jgi:hypothetical protein
MMDHQGLFRVYAQVNAAGKPGEIAVQSVKNGTKVMAAQPSKGAKPFAIALLPSTNTPLSGEDFNYQVLAWSTVEPGGKGFPKLSFSFTLPAGMRYIDLPASCTSSSTSYFEVECSLSLPYASTNDGITRFDLRARPAIASQSSARLHNISYQAHQSDERVRYPDEQTAAVNTVNSALYFDGRDDWAELGYQQADKEFTIEMWVHPYSQLDGQCFAGLHSKDVDGTINNLFLVGYWSGSLHVNVGGVAHNLVSPKVTERFHLVVVVADAGSMSKVTVYVNGVPQEWEEEDRDCSQCKFFNSTMPGGQNSLPWVLGQDWDTGRTSDFFHGMLSEVRIWNKARTKDQVMATYQARPGGSEAALAAYYRLEPVNDASGTLADRAASRLPGVRKGATWIDAAPRYGTAIHFNGYNQALAVPELQLADLKIDPSGYIDLTLGGWLMVNEVPSQQEWIIGSTIPDGSTGLYRPDSQAEMAASVLKEEQTALLYAEEKLEAAYQAAGRLNLDASQAANDSYTARLQLFYFLDILSNQKDELVDIQAGRLLDPLKTPPINLSELEKVDNEEVKNSARDVQAHYDRYQEVRKKYDELSKNMPTPVPTPKPTPAPQPVTRRVCKYMRVLFIKIPVNCYDETIQPAATPVLPGQSPNPFGEYETAKAGQQMLRLLMVEELAQYYSGLQSLYNTVDQNKFNLAAALATSDAYRKKFPQEPKNITDAYLRLKEYPSFSVLLPLAVTQYEMTEAEEAGKALLKSLALPEAEQADAKASVDHLSGPIIKLKSAQDDLDHALVELDAWLEAERQATFAGAVTNTANQPYHFHLVAVQNYLSIYRKAQTNWNSVQASQERTAAAQERVAEAQARVKTAEEAAKPPATALITQSRSLQKSMEAHPNRETALASIEPLLNTAVDQAVDAAFASLQNYDMGSWIIPFIDFDLDSSTDQLTLRQLAAHTVRPDAHLAAYQALKGDAGIFEVKKPARRVFSSSKLPLNQSIIDEINAYLGKLNQEPGQSQISSELSTALAEIIAERVTNDTILCLSYSITCPFPSTSVPLMEQVKKTIKADLSNALETSRWMLRTRLFYQAAHAVARMESELNDGGMAADERPAKVALRNRLAALNTALFQQLNVEPGQLQNDSGPDEQGGITAASSEPPGINTLDDTFQKILTSATSSLKSFLDAARPEGRTPLVTASPALSTLDVADTFGIPTPHLWAGLMVDDDGHVILAVKRLFGGEWIIRKDEKPLQPGHWVHYAAVFRYVPLTDTIIIDDTSPLLYRDGSLVAGVAQVQPSEAIHTSSCPAAFYIGGLCDPGGLFYFAGHIDEVRVWNRMLEKEEIDTWRKLPGAFFNEIAYLSFDDGPGNSTAYITPQGSVRLPIQGPAWVESNIMLIQEATNTR